MELLQLKYFCEAAKNENFTKTAKKFMVPTSDVSQTVNRLEKELEHPLFYRSANRIKLNESGKLFYEKVSLALEKIEEGKKLLRAENDFSEGEIKMQVCTCRRIVTQAIEQFRTSYPGIRFMLHHNIELEDDFDFILSDEIPTPEKYDKTLLVDEDILLAMLPTNPLSEKETLTVQDLRKQRFISMSAKNSLYRILHFLCGAGGFAPDIAIQTDDPSFIRKSVEIGLGVAIFPAFSWKGLFSDSIMVKKIGDVKRKNYIYCKKDRYLSPAVRKFTELLFEITQEYR